MYASVVPLSNFPLQILLSVATVMYYAWAIIILAVLIYKFSLLPYPPDAFGGEIFGLVATLFISSCGRELAGYGNMLELTQPLALGLFFYVISLGGTIYFLWFQTYVVLIDFIISAAVIALVGVIILLGLYTAFTIATQQPWTAVAFPGAPGPQLVQQPQGGSLMGGSGVPQGPSGVPPPQGPPPPPPPILAGIGGIASVGLPPQIPAEPSAVPTLSLPTQAKGRRLSQTGLPPPVMSAAPVLQEGTAQKPAEGLEAKKEKGKKEKKKKKDGEKSQTSVSN